MRKFDLCSFYGEKDDWQFTLLAFGDRALLQFGYTRADWFFLEILFMKIKE